MDASFPNKRATRITTANVSAVSSLLRNHCNQRRRQCPSEAENRVQSGKGISTRMARDDTDAVFEEKSRHHTAALGIGLICLIVGVPLWWKTTEVYRVSLPYSDIQELSESKIEYVSEVEVIWAAGKRPESLLSLLTTKLKKQLGLNIHNKLTPIYRVSARDATDSELKLLEKSSMSQVKEILPSQELNKYNVIVVKKSGFAPQPLFAPYNNIFISYNEADADGLSIQISQLVKNIVRESTLKKKLDSAQGRTKQRPDKNSMRSLSFHSAYDLAFTLIVPEPDKVTVQWDIEGGIEDYLSALRSSLKEFSSLTVSSQVLYLSNIGGKPKKRDDFYYLQEQDLPHIINPMESKLGSHASNNPTLNFIVYVPTQGQSPLYLYDKSDKRVPTNSFFSPRWGGVLIYNWDKEIVNTTHPLRPNMHSIMEVFVTQIRLLLDIPLSNPGEEFQAVATGNSSLTQWELAGWLRSRCLENIATVSNTLKSLAQLLGEINNIVINDDIGKQVEDAVESLKQSHKYLVMGQLKEAFLSSRNALEASEKAFFHPSLLENLYFPEDQKFAIYIPLFLPISIPILSSVFQAIKWFRQRKQKKD